MKSKSPGLFGICRQHLYILFGVWLIVHIFLFYRFGIQDSFVDSQRYIAMGDHLLTEGNLEESFHVFYLIPVVTHQSNTVVLRSYPCTSQYFLSHTDP